jgi:hypothetical protein
MQTIAEHAASADVNGKAATFVRWAMALADEGSPYAAAKGFRGRWPRSVHAEAFEKAAVEAATTGGWGQPLAQLRPFSDAFLEVARNASAVGQIQAAGGFLRGAFNVKIPRQTAASVPSWVGEGAAGHFTSLSFDSLELRPSKLVGLVLLSRELVGLSDPVAENIIGLDLALSIGQFVDAEFLDPTKAGDDISPASITYGAPSVTASGTTADAFRADARNLVEQMRAAGAKLQSPYWVMSPLQALSFGLMDGGLLRGNRLASLPAVTTDAAIAEGDSPEDSRIFLVDAAQVVMADDGVSLDASDQATVTSDTAPDSPATASTVQVSLFQQNLTGLRATRYIRWAPRSAAGAAAGYITGAAYR